MKVKLSVESLKGFIIKCKHAVAVGYRHVGLPWVYAGVLLFAIFYFTGLTNYNFLTIIPLLLIVIGIVGFVHNTKATSKY